MISICAVTIWFNPDETSVNNINSYKDKVRKVFVIDNSLSDNRNLCNTIDNVVYVPNLQNKGIATALNQGCLLAYSEGFEFCMTMDMDSSWDSLELEEYISFVQKEVSDKKVSFCPFAVYEKPQSLLGQIKGFIKIGKEKLITSNQNIIISTDRCITSGNIFLLEIWNKVGRFYEPFFIDEVDYEFCYRLKEYGYEIIQHKRIKMNHILGNPKRTLYPCISHHENVRLYYIFRNLIYQKKMHPIFFDKYNYKAIIFHRVKEVLFNFRFSQIKYLIQAWCDAKYNTLGNYKDRKK